MRYGGNFMLNFDAAVKSKDLTYQQDVILDQIAELIKTNPQIVDKVLRQSGVRLSVSASKSELIDKTIDNIYTNIELQKNLSALLAYKNLHKAEFSNADGEFWGKVKDWFGNMKEKSEDRKANRQDKRDENSSTSSEGSSKPQVTMGADWVSAIAGAVGSVFSFAAANQEKKANQELAKAKLYEKIFGQNQKNKNILPIVIISAVLIIGGVVAYVSLKQK